MILNWFLSRKVREAHSMGKHVRKLLNHQRDLLPAAGVEAIGQAGDALRALLGVKIDKPAIDAGMQNLETVARKWLKPYPHAAWRENFEVLLVALAVAMGIRTFYLQPFKIPTGSMQPTLFGVTSTNLLATGEKIPTGLERVREWMAGASFVHVVAKNDGEITAVSRPVRLLIFGLWQSLDIAGRRHWILFPPDYGNGTLEQRAQLPVSKFYRKGEDVVKLRVNAGDHLFVDRVTYNFRPPKRGEIIVFETKGIPEEKRYYAGIPGDQFYIKRLVALGGEKVEIGKDRHLRINDKRLTAALPHFEHVYSFAPNQPPRDSQYSGHVIHDAEGRNLAPYFTQNGGVVQVPNDQYLVMGDNTVNSLDSRAWGPFPSSYVIGKSFFVYWPLNSRFGWGYHR